MNQEPFLTKRDLPLLVFCLGYLTLGLAFTLAVLPSGTGLLSFNSLAYLSPWALPLACLLCYREILARIKRTSARRIRRDI